MKQQLRSIDKSASANNPFERQFARLKHDVLGRKVKGVEGKPMAQRKKAEENRKKTLKVEMAKKNRVGGLVDRRFGENNPNLSMEDKLMERFMREQKGKSSRNSSLFNLEEEDLTHMGQSISGMDDYSLESGLQRVEDEEGNIDRDTVKYSHFGGFDDDPDPDRKKTKSEIMAEVIAKSKFHKHERQKLNEEVQQLGEEVDENLDDLKSLLLGTGGAKKEEAKPERPWRKPLTSQEEDYDNFIREMRGDARAAPTNRLKTEEEKAFEEKEKLEKMEAERLARMNGPVKSGKKRNAQADDLDDDFGFAQTMPVKKRGGRSKKGGDEGEEDDEDEEEEDDDPRGRNAMPLTYNKDGMLVNKEVFMMKRKPKKGETDEDDGGVDNEEEDDDEEEEYDEDDEDDEDDEEEDGEDGEDDENGNVEAEDDLEEDDAVELNGEEAVDVSADEDDEEEEIDEAAVAAQRAEAQATIPYTFAAPTDHAELLAYVDHLNPTDQAIVIHRIRVLYNAKLGGLNKSKLETLLRVLFDHLQYLTRKSPPDLDTVNALSKHLHELCVQFPQIAAEICIRRIKKLHATIQTAVDKSSALPWLDDIVLLKLVGTVFSVSDFEHVVGTRAQLLMAEFLVMCPATNGRQALSGIVLCQVLKEFVKTSKRYIPEVISFLHSLLDALHPSSSTNKNLSITSLSAPPMDLDLKTLLAKPATTTKKVEQHPSFKTDAFKAALLATVTNVIGQFVRIYSDASGFIEIFTPLLEKLEGYATLFQTANKKKSSKPSEALTNAFKVNIDIVKGLLASGKLKRKPLLLQKRKAMAIRTFVPKFQEHYSMDRRFDPNRERAKVKKDEAEYKKEFKGAMRELRKDGKFIARQRLEERKEKDAVYKKKMDRIMGDLANLEGAMRGYERMNKK
ncbi:Nop14-like protein [Rhizoclosmatium globosum]|uniref:Nop14-like protein n=1 Tax=Rhizoclosmatium globosum TaxID=329046 RepID=A0A1Y2BCF9_9FUNG|nr:Nop14-like protein [Rhizoclosmatium globosum]|eukprot:ORY32396.1 Nop14-like protein [Rhizoclosmatium globosum]